MNSRSPLSLHPHARAGSPCHRHVASALLACTVFLASHAIATPTSFDFGPGPARDGSTPVLPNNPYSDSTGYGFEPGPAHPAYFSLRLPEGHYLVTVTLGGADAATDTTIKSEMRRLMLESVRTKPGETVTRTFAVNVRTPAIAGTNDNVRLKQRERDTEMRNWDDKLTLEFNGPRPAVRTLTVTPAPDLPTVYLLGDSTVCDQPAEPWNSWGQMLPRFFKPTVAVSNHANSGESLRSSLSAKRLAKVTSTMKEGDYLLIQYGHNDMKQKGDGVGAFTTYKADLKRFADAARAKGATVILITSMERKAGVDHDTLGEYPAAVRALAKEENLPLIDLHATSTRLYKSLGADLGKAFQDGTHHNNYGSYELAKCVAQGIRDAKLDLASHLADDFTGFDPDHPDPPDTFKVPPSATNSTTKPLGN